MRIYKVSEGGERLDKIIFDEYGFLDGAIEQVYLENVFLEKLGDVVPLSIYGNNLPEGLTFTLPDLAPPVPQKTFTLLS